MRGKAKSAAIFLLLTLAATAGAEMLDGRAYRVVDGDTLMVLDGANRQREIRLFGIDAPESSQLCEAKTGKSWRCGAAAANALGLTTQVPVRSVYLTSGRSRKIHLGKQVVELRHAPRWQLALANRPAGEAVRALAWLGPEKAEAALTTLKRKMPPGVFGELVAAAPQLPTWLAQSVGKAAYG